MWLGPIGRRPVVFLSTNDQCLFPRWFSVQVCSSSQKITVVAWKSQCQYNENVQRHWLEHPWFDHLTDAIRETRIAKLSKCHKLQLMLQDLLLVGYILWFQNKPKIQPKLEKNSKVQYSILIPIFLSPQPCYFRCPFYNWIFVKPTLLELLFHFRAAALHSQHKKVCWDRWDFKPILYSSKANIISFVSTWHLFVLYNKNFFEELFHFFSWEKWRIAMCDTQLASSNLLNLLWTKKSERETDKSSWPSVTFKDKKGPVKKQRLSELTHAVVVASGESEKTLLAAKMRSKSKKYWLSQWMPPLFC